MQRTIPIERDILVCVPEDYSKAQRGAFFERFCADILRKQSYEIIGIEVRKTGMEIDIQARHKPSGKDVYVECKFYNSKKIDANIVDLCFSQAVRAKAKSIALFSTAALSKDAKGAYQDYLEMDDCDYSFYGGDEIIDALEACGKVKSFDSLELPANITHASLLAHPELPFTWLFQEVLDGTANNLIAYSYGAEVDCERIRDVLDSDGLFENINVKEFNSPSSEYVHIEKNERAREVVSSIVVADDIMDYKPCRPADFVGRDAIQKEIWDYLESVREKKTDTRILSLTGSSGNGKSSLVAFLSERFRNVKWKNKFYLFPVDVRSARGARFVSEAVVKAFKSAIKDSFIVTDGDFTIENVSDITSGANFKQCSKFLETNNKVIVIFFDQFEEVFMKEELFSLFRAFERFAIDVSSENTNLVVGFSWRSGITLGDENPAYSMWNRLRDFRIDKKLTQFDIKDSSKLISTFEKDAGIKLNKSLRARLIQQSQGYPWLLKKLCIHLFKKIRDGVSQEQLLITQLQIKSLFDEDLERPDKETACLRYVAKYSPVDQYEATKEFGPQTISNLLADRLFIKTGEKISVYWDVFRDYLITDEAPVIPWSYMPAASLSMSLSMLNTIDNLADTSFSNLQSNTAYKKGTLINIIMDLQSFSLIEKDDEETYKLSCDKDQVPEVVRSHFIGHIVYVKALNLLVDITPDTILIEEFSDIVSSIYANKDGKTPKGYAAKLIAWLQYAGLISKGANKIRVYRDADYSPEFGNSGVKSYLFLAATTPEKSNALIRKLKIQKKISQDEQDSLKARNAVLDLISLGICKRNEDSSVMLSKSVKDTLEPEHTLALAVAKVESILILKELIKTNGLDREILANKLRDSLGKSWKDSSSKRYLNGMLKYIEYSDAYLNSLA